MPQLKLDRFHFGRFRSSFLPALLMVALGVTGVVSLHGYRASQEHRAVFERVLAFYVSLVAERAQLATEVTVVSCADYWLHPAITAVPAADVQAIRTDACGVTKALRFDLDLQNNRVISAQGLKPELVAWLLKSIPGNEELENRPSWKLGVLTASIESRPELISYAVQTADNAETRAVGFVAIGALDHIFTAAMAEIPVPEELGAAGTLTDYFYIDHSRNPQGAGAPADALFLQEHPLRAGFAGLGIRVGMLPAALNQVAPHGMPPNRGFEFLALFGLAAGLVISSLLLLRREEQLARTRANFVSGVSHELRTPLAQIRMFAEMLLLGRVRTEGDRRRSLEIIDTEARRLSQLVENVLQVARSENGHMHVNPTNMRIAPIVRECVESFSMLAQARSIEFRTELQEDLIAPVDSAALRQIVLNLLDNAAKYGPVGQRVVAGVALFENHARIWVDDEGAGVPARERQRVFDPFYRIRDSHNTTGSGIGLAVVRELVALHGGVVWIEDAPDAGARVVVQFPGAYLTPGQATGDFAVA